MLEAHESGLRGEVAAVSIGASQQRMLSNLSDVIFMSLESTRLPSPALSPPIIR